MLNCTKNLEFAERGAAYVMKRLAETDCAVFLVNGRIRTMFPAGARFDQMCYDFPEALVGVYVMSSELFRQQIAADIMATPGVILKNDISI